jgi:hypothetical protein
MPFEEWQLLGIHWLWWPAAITARTTVEANVQPSTPVQRTSRDLDAPVSLPLNAFLKAP